MNIATFLQNGKKIDAHSYFPSNVNKQNENISKVIARDCSLSNLTGSRGESAAVRSTPPSHPARERRSRNRRERKGRDTHREHVLPGLFQDCLVLCSLWAPCISEGHQRRPPLSRPCPPPQPRARLPAAPQPGARRLAGLWNRVSNPCLARRSPPLPPPPPPPKGSRPLPTASPTSGRPSARKAGVGLPRPGSRARLDPGHSFAAG